MIFADRNLPKPIPRNISRLNISSHPFFRPRLKLPPDSIDLEHRWQSSSAQNATIRLKPLFTAIQDGVSENTTYVPCAPSSEAHTITEAVISSGCRTTRTSRLEPLERVMLLSYRASLLRWGAAGVDCGSRALEWLCTQNRVRCTSRSQLVHSGTQPVQDFRVGYTRARRLFWRGVSTRMWLACGVGSRRSWRRLGLGRGSWRSGTSVPQDSTRVSQGLRAPTPVIRLKQIPQVVPEHAPCSVKVPGEKLTRFSLRSDGFDGHWRRVLGREADGDLLHVDGVPMMRTMPRAVG